MRVGGGRGGGGAHCTTREWVNLQKPLGGGAGYGLRWFLASDEPYDAIIKRTPNVT